MNKKLLLASVFATFVGAFDNTAGWKLDADGKIEMKDGNPVYLNAAGQEQVVQGDTITRLNGEAKTHREGKEAAELKLKAFEGLDPEIARKAVETVGKIDAKKLIDAGEVDKVRDAIKAEFTAQLTEKDKTIGDLQSNVGSLNISKVFDGSEFVRDQVATPRDMFQSAFAQNFKYEDGKVIAYDRAGNRLMSKARAGEYAEPDEAIQLLVDAHPQKDLIIKAQTGGGSGNGGGGGNRGGGRTMRRADFEALPPHEQTTIAAQAGKGEMRIVD